MWRIRRRKSSTQSIQQAAPPANVWGFGTELVHIIGAWIAKPRASEAPSSAAKTSTEVVYELMVKRIEWQIRAGEASDAKTTAWLGFVTLVLSVSASVLIAEHTRSIPAFAFAGLGVLCWLGVVGNSRQAYESGEFSWGPTNEDLIDLADDPSYSGLNTQALVAKFIATVTLPNNERGLRSKAAFFSTGFRWAIAQIFCLMAAAALAIFA